MAYQSVQTLPDELESVRRLRESAEGGPGSGPQPRGYNRDKKNDVHRKGQFSKASDKDIDKQHQIADKHGYSRIAKRGEREKSPLEIFNATRDKSREGGPGSGPRTTHYVTKSGAKIKVSEHPEEYKAQIHKDGKLIHNGGKYEAKKILQSHGIDHEFEKSGKKLDPKKLAKAQAQSAKDWSNLRRQAQKDREPAEESGLRAGGPGSGPRKGMSTGGTHKKNKTQTVKKKKKKDRRSRSLRDMDPVVGPYRPIYGYRTDED
jgi:hypothetical protein